MTAEMIIAENASVKVRFRCPECGVVAQTSLADSKSWQCRHCDYLIALPDHGDQGLPACVICGNQEKELSSLVGADDLGIGVFRVPLGSWEIRSDDGLGHLARFGRD